ncbi:MAG: cytochrome P450 [Leptospirales bacterium]|nr:cytochrome P450 [Leptospirales bacterium]
MQSNAAAVESGQLYIPRGKPVVGVMLRFASAPLEFLSEMRDRAPIVRMHGLRKVTYLINEPALVDEVLTTRARSFRKDFFTRRLSNLLGQGLLTSEGELWRRQRRLIQPAFHRERVDSYAQIMTEETARRIQAWKADLATASGGVLLRDWHHDMMALTLEIVARSLFGQRMDQESAAIAWALDRLMEQQAKQFTISGAIAGNWFPSPTNVRYWKAKKLLYRIVAALVQKSSSAPGLIADLLAARDEENQPMSVEQIRDEAVTLILAGHETTANALSWAAWLLGDRPELQQRIADEARQVFGERRPSANDCAALNFCGAVIREAMRLYPPAWLIGREAVEDVQIGGVTIRRGEQAAMCQYSMHRNPKLFEAADEFRPERWLDGLERRLPRMAYFPFGGGQRMCIGSGFAMLEATLLLSMICKAVQFERGSQRVKPEAAVTLRPQGGLPMRLRLRS